MKKIQSEEVKKYVAYYRVSTQKQGLSGLGLDAQKQTVKNYIGGADQLIAEFIEVESGKNNKRIELLKALDMAKKNSATLIIAKLDRLSRNVSFIFALKDSNVNFFACDVPEFTTLTLGFTAIIAQHEREITSKRTTEALAQKKLQGFLLGTPENLTDYSRRKSIEIRTQNANEDENNIKAFCLIKSLKTQNLSLGKIADELNKNGFKTRRNNEFSSMTVKRIYERMNTVS